ncbi:universal stress protein [Saccharopolyspora rosea]|uniref:Universal stress protein n=1 Tax=Saccharopolyspora rosea TaxID=524884 RepID=A0ABW3FYU6_9PSEU|nr:universal stress protein [Saccharopolyspora rosea]
MSGDEPILVGVDGSDRSLKAGAWAATEGARLGAPLLLVMAAPEADREYAERVCQDAAERCRETGVEVRAECPSGNPVEQLLRCSEKARMAVLGSRGHGGFVSALLGSVSTAVAAHASCPVVVVRGQVLTTGPVVVGVDESEGSEAALRFAFEAAARRDAELVAVQALPAAYFARGPLPHPDREDIEQEAELQLAEQLAGWRQQYPDVPVRRVTSNDHPVAALRDTAHDAQLLVVGNRGRGGFRGMVIGSVANGVLHHAPCPVAVVRA